jgi:hypothetical protein
MIRTLVPSTCNAGARSFGIANDTGVVRTHHWFHAERTAGTDHIIRIEESMKSYIARAVLTVVITMAAACGDTSPAPTGLAATRAPAQSAASAAEHNADKVAFGFNGTASGFPTGEVFLTGGGNYNISSASNVVGQETRAVSNGGFRCLAGVEQGLLTHCATGEGVRWDTAQLLASTPFKCTASDAVKTAVTGEKRVVLLADFYRAGDGNDESFTAPMIVSETDLAPNIPGEQNIWVQGVGCGTAVVNFN